MEIYDTQEKLLKHFQGIPAPEYERDSMQKLLRFLYTKNDHHVMILYGLRRTGKTTLCQQAITRHIDMSSTILITCDINTDINDVIDTIKSSEAHYVFIDEVTRAKDFAELASVFSDSLAYEGKKIVLLGTDSLLLAFVSTDGLYDREYTIHTTYIPFREFHRLKGGDLFQYMQYGGTLNDDTPFRNSKTLQEYTNSAITDNLLHTYDTWKAGSKIDELLKGLKREELYSLIVYFLRREAHAFLARYLKPFEASEFLSVTQMYTSKRKRQSKLGLPLDELLNPQFVIENTQLFKDWQKQLKILDTYTSPIDESVVSSIRNHLASLEVLSLVDVGTEVFAYFSQPGMRYCHIEEAIYLLEHNEQILSSYSLREINEFAAKIKADIEGRLLEEIILLDLFKRYHNNKDIMVLPYRNDNKEYDIAVINTTTYKAAVFEVKRSSVIEPQQKKWLLDYELEQKFKWIFSSAIIKKAVLYSGETCLDAEGFQYINSSEFLLDTDNILCDIVDVHNNVKIIMQVSKQLNKNGVDNLASWIDSHTTTEVLSILD